MRNPLLYLLFFLVSSCFMQSKSSKSDTYFLKNRNYHYNSLYIDSAGDTIIKGQVIVQPLERPWLWQWSIQESVNYIYFNDSMEYNKYKDPEFSIYLQQQKYLRKHGRMKLYPKELTGGYMTDSTFYIHPPRANQYRMLNYAAHPFARYLKLEDTTVHQVATMRIYGLGKLYNVYSQSPLERSSLDGIGAEVKVWGINVESHIDFTNEYYKFFPIFNSSLEAEYCKEFGFVKMHYSFQNGIKIQLNFVKMTEE
jgi:hypothetical protein